MKVGFIATAHWSDKYRPDGGKFITRFCNTLHESCIYDYNLYVIDNSSQYKLNIPNSAIYIFIEDQTKEGITGAWNLGINCAYEDGCDIIINCNDDLWFNETINILIQHIIDNSDVNAIYSGLTDGILHGTQLSNGPGTGIQIKNGHNIIGGFCFAMTRNHYEKYRFEKTKYFNVNNKYNGGDGKWGGQEGQFMENSEKGLYGIVVNECFIPHTKVRGWKQLKNL